jgi:hypothetical protein
LKPYKNNLYKKKYIEFRIKREDKKKDSKFVKLANKFFNKENMQIDK